MNKVLKNSLHFLLFMPLMTLAPTALAQSVPSQTEIAAKVQTYFADMPVMQKIAQCESGTRQYDQDGAVLFDASYSMIGLFQISAIHLPESIGEGMDILTSDGNMAYARKLYTQNSTDPWMDSFSCWGASAKPLGTVLGTSTQATTNAPSTNTSSMRLALGMTSSSIVALQQLLNRAGFVIASDGAGSPGQETNKFGTLTRAAVRRFQCAKGLVCSGDESTTGYGVVDDTTYTALLQTQTSSSGTASSTTINSGSFDKAAQIAQVESQIASLTAQLGVLNAQLTKLSQ